jgi:hypothetical protein
MFVLSLIGTLLRGLKAHDRKALGTALFPHCLTLSV